MLTDTCQNRYTYDHSYFHRGFSQPDISRNYGSSTPPHTRSMGVVISVPIMMVCPRIAPGEPGIETFIETMNIGRT